MAATKSRITQPLGRLTLPRTGVVFSGKRYADSSVNLLFKKMRARTPGFHGVLAVQSESARFYLVIIDNEPYAAGREQQGVFVPLTLRGLFTGLRKLPSDGTELSLVGADPLFLKSILTVMQCSPTTEGTTELLEIGSVVGHIKKGSQDQLLVVGRGGELSLFYFRGGQLIAGYFADPAFETGEDSLEERLLAYVYQYAGQGTLALHVFAAMSAHWAEDGVFERGAWPDELVQHFTRPVPALLILGADGASRRFELTAQSVSLGRGEDNDIVVDDPAISRRHLLFRLEASGVTVEDCGSRNGTMFNGAPLTKTSLTHGAELQIGECLIRFLGGAQSAESVEPEERGEETICRPAADLSPPSLPPPPPAPAAETWGLDVVRPDGSSSRLILHAPVTTIGRVKADLTLVDTKVSRRHGELEVSGEGVLYRDTGSTNGSLLNGRAVTNALLKPGDVLKIGETSLTVFREAA
ncbi:MAG: FHA domain-containing protein [Nitrospirota bacterium]